MIDVTFFQGDFLSLLGKGSVLFLIGIYFLFSVVITFQVRSLNSIVRSVNFSLSSLIPLLFLIHLLLVVSLFILALAIL